MAAVTLEKLKERARVQADMVGSTFVTDAELVDFLNAGADELYDLLVTKFEDYYVTSTSVAVSAGQDSYDLPADFLKLRGVEALSGGRYYDLRRFNFSERNRYVGSEALEHLQYQARGGSLFLLPAPSTAGVVRLWYVPQRTQLSVDADTLDGISGWEEYAVLFAAIRMLDKEESDSGAKRADLAAMRKRIDESASARDAGAPARIVDVTEDDFGVW